MHQEKNLTHKEILKGVISDLWFQITQRTTNRSANSFHSSVNPHKFYSTKMLGKKHF